MTKLADVMNWIVVSDIHAGCQLGLCPTSGVTLDNGGSYKPNTVQKKVFGMWTEFWNKWVPKVCRGEEFGIIVNGDTLDGVHHKSNHQISHNLNDQSRIAYEILAPLVDTCEGRLFMIRGTEAHVGPSGEQEERLARELGAIPNKNKQYARYDLWKKIGKGLVHVLHHIGTTGSQAYEATAVHKELVEEYAEAGRWGQRPPDVIIRSHRHRCVRTSIPTARGDATAIVTPGWQGKTPFVWKVPGGRLSTPQFGGVLIRQGDEDLYVRHQVWTINRSDIA